MEGLEDTIFKTIEDLVREGMIVPFTREDGELMYRLTEKGKAYIAKKRARNPFKPPRGEA